MLRAAIAGIIVATLAATACGKKGNPLPPLRPLPARIADLTVARTAGKVELRFTIPATNADGTTPPAIDRVDIYAMAVQTETAVAPGATGPTIPGTAGKSSGLPAAPDGTPQLPQVASELPDVTPQLPAEPSPAVTPEANPPATPLAPDAPLPGSGPAASTVPQGAPGAGLPTAGPAGLPVAGPAGRGATKPTGPQPPTAAQIVADSRNLRQSQPVRRPVAEGAPQTPATTLVPAPGDMAVVVDSTVAAETTGAVALYYVAVPVAGLGRGRPGQASVIARVPLTTPPVPPAEISVTNNETQVVVSWKPSASGQGFRVFRSSSPPATPPDAALTGAPVTASEFTLPVEFGREVCVTVRAVEVSGPVTVEGTNSEPACLTPVDRYPPAAPVGLRVVQEGTAVTVIWEAVDAADLAGYIVLRGEGASPALQPLVREPLNSTTYRDATAQTGVAYTYAVYAVDSAPTPNVGELSVREAITVR